jgi:hypothetical protein
MKGYTNTSHDAVNDGYQTMQRVQTPKQTSLLNEHKGHATHLRPTASPAQQRIQRQIAKSMALTERREPSAHAAESKTCYHNGKNATNSKGCR